MKTPQPPIPTFLKQKGSLHVGALEEQRRKNSNTEKSACDSK